MILLEIWSMKIVLSAKTNEQQGQSTPSLLLAQDSFDSSWELITWLVCSHSMANSDSTKRGLDQKLEPKINSKIREKQPSEYQWFLIYRQTQIRLEYAH